MLHDIGFEASEGCGAKLKQFVIEMDRIFDLVRITERMDKSQIILKNPLRYW